MTVNRYQIVFLLACACLFLSLLTKGWVWTWTGAMTPILGPAFHDLASIPAAIRAIDAGLNPRLGNPFDALGARYNYPAFWLSIGGLLKWDDTTSFLLAGSVIGVSTLAVWYLLLGLYPSMLLLLFTLSDPTRALIVSGNIDGVAFVLVFAALTVRKESLSRGLIALAGFSKLFPLAALIGFIRNRNHLLVSVLIGAAVLLANAKDLASMRAATPVSAVAYGLTSLQMSIEILTGQLVPVWTYSLPLLLGPIIAGAFSPTSQNPPMWTRSDLFFVTGALIFVSTFILIGSNFAYRVSFLGFCIPYIRARLDRVTQTLIGGGLLILVNLQTLLHSFGMSGAILTLVGTVLLFEWFLFRLVIEFKPWFASRSFPQRARA